MDKKRSGKKKHSNAIDSPEPSTSSQNMGKRKRPSKEMAQTFEPSSGETTPDPFSDDGEYGSDVDYDPVCRVSTSSSEENNSDSEQSNCINDDTDTSCESIFDTSKRSALSAQQKAYEKDTDSERFSMDSVTLRNNIDCNITSINLSTLPDPDLLLNTTREKSPDNLTDLDSRKITLIETSHVSVAETRSPPPLTLVTLSDSVVKTSNLISLAPSVNLPDPVTDASSLILHELPPLALLNPVTETSSLTPGTPTSVCDLEPVLVPLEENPAVSPSTLDRTATQPRNQNTRMSPESDWENTTSDIPYFEFDSSSAGVQFDIGPNTTALDVFKKLFPSHILDYLIERTNAYGQSLCSTNRPCTRKSRRYSYKDTDTKEMHKFLGLCLLMGQVKTPNKRQLFTYSDPLYYHPIFAYVMSARRFEQLLRCLYASELNSKGKDKIIKFIDILSSNFRDCYKPGKELSLDESLLLFRGRLVFKNYIKNKKARYGIKFYELASHDGYVLNIIMYAGKEEEDQNESGKKTEAIVMQLMKPYLLKGHWLFMDNYYNSTTLSQKLLELRTHSTGTLRSNRKGNPKVITTKKLKKGEHVWVRKNKVYVSKWVDKRPVLMITTSNQPKLIEITNRYGKKKIKPEEVETYNQFMSGIDRADQMTSYYSSPRKSLRWYKKVIYHLLDLAVWNSFYLYRKYCRNNCTFLNFRENLIRSLLDVPEKMTPELLVLKHNKFDNRIKEREGLVLPTILEQSENIGHWPEKIPVREGSKKTSNYMKCKMCTKNKKRRETGIRCKGCPEKPPLCAICFEEWHNQS